MIIFSPGALEQMRMLVCHNSASEMIPVENPLAIVRGEFTLAAELCASSVAQGGPAPNFSSDWVFDYLVGGLKSIKFDYGTELQDENMNTFRQKVGIYIIIACTVAYQNVDDGGLTP